MLERIVKEAWSALDEARDRTPIGLTHTPIGTVVQAGDGVVRIAGLPKVKSGEVLELSGGARALALDLEPEQIHAVLLDRSASLRAGAQAVATGQVVQVPVGDGLLGRVVDSLGRPLDGGGPVEAEAWYGVEREATPIMQRAPVSEPLQTGIKAVDALVPIGKGQRELILGDRQTGKTAVALDAILNQHGADVLCVYVAIGQRATSTAQLIETLRVRGALTYSIVVVASGDEPAGLRYLAPYAATSMAEYFMERGRDVLIVYDDLTKHAESYRELSLILRRPPAREAYPGDIFYAHSRLLERATRLRDTLGGGSLTALPIAETQAEDMSAYVPTNLISITDGQIYLSTELFQQGIRPAVHVGQSVSRVGGKSQVVAYRQVAAQLKLSYSQFEELEFFSRLGTRLDAVSEQIIRRGQRIREVLKQGQGRPLPVGEQIALLTVLNEGLLDNIPPEHVAQAEARLYRVWRQELGPLLDVVAERPWSGAERERLLATARQTLQDETTWASSRPRAAPTADAPRQEADHAGRDDP